MRARSIFSVLPFSLLAFALPAAAQPSPPSLRYSSSPVVPGNCVSVGGPTTVTDTGTPCGGGVTVPPAGLVFSNGTVLGDATYSGCLSFAAGVLTSTCTTTAVPAAGIVASNGTSLVTATIVAPLTLASSTTLKCSTCLTANQSITISGDVSGTGTTAITAVLATVPIAKGGTGQTTAVLGRVALNTGTSSPSTAAATITPDCSASNVFTPTLTTGVGPYTLANCNAAPTAGSTFVIVFKQPASGSPQTVTTYGSMYLFPAPFSHASPPPLTATLNAVDVLSCVARTASELDCTFSGNFT